MLELLTCAQTLPLGQVSTEGTGLSTLGHHPGLSPRGAQPNPGTAAPSAPA